MAWWLFQNVVITTALAALVVVVCRTTRIGPVARHALWVLVLLKFVTPPLVVWPWPAPDPLGLATLDVRMDTPPIPRGPSTLVAGTDGMTPRDRDVFPVSDAEVSAPVDPRDAAAPVGHAALPWIIMFWVAGSLCLAAIEGVRLARLARQVKEATPADPAIVNRVVELSAQLGLRPVPVLTVRGCASPAVWCLGQPRLLWPAALSDDPSRAQSRDSTDACIDGVLVHELAHVKRRDHFVGWIELAAGIVWWWNPLFWFVRSALREQAELACDAWVISALPNGRRAYAESLLALSGAVLRGTPSRSMAAVVGIRSGNRRVLERRLVMIMKGRAPLRLPMAGLLALALMAGATLPAWATGSQQQPPPPPPPPAAKPAPAAKPEMPPPPPPAAKPRPVELQVKPQIVPPPPPRPRTAVGKGALVWGQPMPTPRNLAIWLNRPDLPADGRQLVEGYNADLQAIQQESERKIEERRETVVKALEALQDQYTKAGKLDEALVIRDFLRAGGPGRDELYSWNRLNRVRRE
ncbi:MAG TPA: M56 family metallopeptidase [Vicinamibacterales bacterium]|nr:M56 family metallopeptidase [Vicinamibacterales bacterium]